MDETARRRLNGVIARSARLEDGYSMTRAARQARWDKLRAEALERNPELRGAELEAAVKLLMRRDMAKLSMRRWPKRS
jgi:hypothetical protein